MNNSYCSCKTENKGDKCHHCKKDEMRWTQEAGSGDSDEMSSENLDID